MHLGSLTSRWNAVADRWQRWVWRAAPPPPELRLTTVGIDISEQTVKFAVVSVEGGKPVVCRWGKRSCADALLSGATIGNPEAFVAHLRKIAARTGCRVARASLAEEAGYLFRVAVAPPRSFEELRAQVEFQLSENIPLQPSEVVFDAVPAVYHEGSLLVDVAAYPKKLITTLTSLFTEAGLTLASLEIEGAAIARSVLPLGTKGAFFLTDIGNTEAAVYVVEDGHLLFSAKLPVGGAHFTEAIRTTLGVGEEEAEHFKQTELLLHTPSSSSLAPAHTAVLEVANTLVQALQRHLLFWREHQPTAGYSHAPLEQVLLVGGTAQMPGLATFLSKALAMPVALGDVWTNFPPYSHYIPPIPRNEALQYATALGLALRDALPALAPPRLWH